MFEEKVVAANTFAEWMLILVEFHVFGSAEQIDVYTDWPTFLGAKFILFFNRYCISAHHMATKKFS